MNFLRVLVVLLIQAVIGYDAFRSPYMRSLGCWKDKESRILEHQMSEIRGVRQCIRQCSLGGYRFAGVEYGKQCFCGSNPFTTYGRSTECNMRCQNKREYCGGFWAMNVYATGSFGRQNPLLIPGLGDVPYPGPLDTGYPVPGEIGYPVPGGLGYPLPGELGFPVPGEIGFPGLGDFPYPGPLGAPYPGPLDVPYPGPLGAPYPGPLDVAYPGPLDVPYPGPLDMPYPGPLDMPYPGPHNLGLPVIGEIGHPVLNNIGYPGFDNIFDPTSFDGYIGCYGSLIEERSLRRNFRVSGFDECARYCRQNGCRYGGLMMNGRCSCGDSYSSPLSSSQCLQPCHPNDLNCQLNAYSVYRL